jgi:N-acyl-D-amino-acid deacylase
VEALSLSTDTIISGGKIINGTGNPWFLGDIGIKNGKISRIGKLKPSKATAVIDAKGLVVCPGFIDAHSHTDMVLQLDPKTESTIRQGITTMVVGNCGFSLAPIADAYKSLLEKSLSQFIPRGASIALPWNTFDEYLKHEEGRSIASNVVYLVGHGTVRTAAMGYDRRSPTVEELEEMKEYVAEAMEAGAVGLSSGLIYPPGMYADGRELVELAKVASSYGGVFTSHIRGEGETLVEAVSEALKVGQEADIPIQISHHKAFGKTSWGQTRKTLQMMEESRGKGVDVTYDQYPYEAGMTSLATLLPPWAHEGGMEELLNRLKTPEDRNRMVRDIEKGLPGWMSHAKECGWENIVLSSVGSEKNRDLEGKNLVEIARIRESEVTSVLLDLLLEESGQATMIIFCMDEDDIRRVMAHPYQMVGTDSWAVSTSGIMAAGKPHPRFYGTYPRVLGRYVRELNVLRLEEAIRKMTSFPAQRFGISGRGILAPGYWADIVIFDPETIIDKATYEKPHQFPEGIKHVLVNGEVAISGGENTGALAGRVQRRV